MGFAGIALPEPCVLPDKDAAGIWVSVAIGEVRTEMAVAHTPRTQVEKRGFENLEGLARISVELGGFWAKTVVPRVSIRTNWTSFAPYTKLVYWFIPLFKFLYQFARTTQVVVCPVLLPQKNKAACIMHACMH